MYSIFFFLPFLRKTSIYYQVEELLYERKLALSLQLALSLLQLVLLELDDEEQQEPIII